jgi:hypothetical protein
MGTYASSRRNLGVVAALIMLLAAACGTAKSAGGTQATQSVEQAKVTGYKSAPLSASSSGPVSVTVHGASAAGLYQLVAGLKPSSGTPCMEEPQLYQIAFTTASGTRTVDGYSCEGYVTTSTVSGGSTYEEWSDQHCTLLLAVRKVLPPSATATQKTNNPCPS